MLRRLLRVPVLQKAPGVYLVLERSFTFPVSKVDNLEGMAWSPDRTLWLVSDDNFSAAQVTQFIALAVR